MNLLMTGLNIVYAIIGIIIGLNGMKYGYKMLDKLTDFDTSTELKNGNTAVGIIIGGLLIGVGICAGLIIGMALN